MACKRCGSIAQQEFDGELAVTFPDLKSVNLPPVYVCSRLLVCLDCGFTDLMIPKPKLESLRKRSAASRSQIA
jgi:hypothetical protein